MNELTTRGDHCQPETTYFIYCSVNMFATLSQLGPDGSSQHKQWGFKNTSKRSNNTTGVRKFSDKMGSQSDIY